MVDSHVKKPVHRPLYEGDILRVNTYQTSKENDLKFNDIFMLLSLEVVEYINKYQIYSRKLFFKILHKEKVKEFYIFGPDDGYYQFELIENLEQLNAF